MRLPGSAQSAAATRHSESSRTLSGTSPGVRCPTPAAAANSLAEATCSTLATRGTAQPIADAGQLRPTESSKDTLTTRTQKSKGSRASAATPCARAQATNVGAVVLVQVSKSPTVGASQAGVASFAIRPHQTALIHHDPARKTQMAFQVPQTTTPIDATALHRALHR